MGKSTVLADFISYFCAVEYLKGRVLPITYWCAKDICQAEVNCAGFAFIFFFIL